MSHLPEWNKALCGMHNLKGHNQQDATMMSGELAAHKRAPLRFALSDYRHALHAISPPHP